VSVITGTYRKIEWTLALANFRPRAPPYAYVDNAKTNTYKVHQTYANGGARRAQQRDSPPVEQISQDERDQSSGPRRHARQRRHGAPESGLGDLADVRQNRRLAEPDAQAHQHGGRVEHRDGVRTVQQYPPEYAGHVREDHALFPAVPLLQEPGQKTYGRMEHEQYASCAHTREDENQKTIDPVATRFVRSLPTYWFESSGYGICFTTYFRGYVRFDVNATRITKNRFA